MSNPNNASGLARAFNGVAVIAAIAGTVFIAPQVWPLVEMPIWHALLDLYSFETAGWLLWAAKIAAWPLTFCAIRVSLSGLFTALGLLALRRAM